MPPPFNCPFKANIIKRDSHSCIILSQWHHRKQKTTSSYATTIANIPRFAAATQQYAYVYGLTATPLRKDGHHPIIFMQCGPIRFVADAKAQIERQSFKRVLIPRFTSFRNIAEEQNFVQMAQSLASDELRNKMIVDDVVKALSELPAFTFQSNMKEFAAKSLI